MFDREACFHSISALRYVPLKCYIPYFTKPWSIITF